MLSGVRILNIDIPFLSMVGLNDTFSIILTIGWIVGITNAVNLIDGLDGLATGVSAISAFSLLIVFALNGSSMISIVLISALAGSLIGFLPYNFNPAKTFMGDAGSNFLGFTLAAISIIGTAKTYTAFAIAAPVLILALPIFDTLFAIFRRLKSRKSIIKGDNGHLHHRLIKAGFTQKQAVLALYIATALLRNICSSSFRKQ